MALFDKKTQNNDADSNLDDQTKNNGGAKVTNFRPSKMDGDVVYVSLNCLHPNPYQPRTEFGHDDLQELADSIKAHGILQPLTITGHPKLEEEYYIVAGERRRRAAEMAGLAKVPAIIRKVDDDQEMAELGLIENVQRTDLNPMEAARAYQRLIDEFGMTQEVIAEKTGKSQSSINKALMALNAPANVQQAVEEEKMPITAAASMAGLTEKEAEPIVEAVKNGQMNRDEIIGAAKAVKAEKAARKAVKKERDSAKNNAPTGVNILREYSENGNSVAESEQTQDGVHDSALSPEQPADFEKNDTPTGVNILREYSVDGDQRTETPAPAPAPKRPRLAAIAADIVPIEKRKKTKASFNVIFDMLEECGPEIIAKLAEAMLAHAANR